MHPDDAAARGIADGDVVRVFNDRGACFAAAQVTDDVRAAGGATCRPARGSRPSTPPSDVATCARGNPNVLTADRGTSRLAQGCTGQHVLVEIEKVIGPAPPVDSHRPPRFAARRTRA